MQVTDYAGIAAIILAIVAIYKAWRGNPVETADAAKTWQELAALSSLEQKRMREELLAFQVQLDAMCDELEEYRDGVNILIKQLELKKIVPQWRPRIR